MEVSVNGNERGRVRRDGSEQLVFGKLLTQGVAVDVEPARRERLIALGMLHHRGQQRFFHRGQHHGMNAVRLGTAEVVEIGLEAIDDTLFERGFAGNGGHGGMRVNGTVSGSQRRGPGTRIEEAAQRRELLGRAAQRVELTAEGLAFG